MKISVVIPTYNRLPQLSEVLDHLLASDIEGFEDIEIIVVDDGSRESADACAGWDPTLPPTSDRGTRRDEAGLSHPPVSGR